MALRDASLGGSRRWIGGVGVSLAESSCPWFSFQSSSLFGGRWTLFVRLFNVVDDMMIYDLGNMMNVHSCVAI